MENTEGASESKPFLEEERQKKKGKGKEKLVYFIRCVEGGLLPHTQ